MDTSAWIVIALTLAVLLVVTLAVRTGTKQRRATAKRNLRASTQQQSTVQLSVVEQCCLQTLQQVAGQEHHIRTKVSPAALSAPADLSRQLVDFVLFSKRGGGPACAIQLKSGKGQDEQEVENTLAKLNIPVYHLPRKSSYSIIEMRELLAAHLEMPPPSPDEMLATVSMQAFRLCSKCDAKMNLKRASSGPHKGMLFWVCTNYPDNCSGVEIYTEQ